MKWFLIFTFTFVIISCDNDKDPEFDYSYADDEIEDADNEEEVLNSYTYEESSSSLDKGIIKSSVACGDNVYFSKEFKGSTTIYKYNALEMSWKIEINERQSQSVNSMACGKNGNFFAAGDRTAEEGSNLAGFVTEFNSDGKVINDFELDNGTSVSIYSIFADESENVFICGRVDGSFEGTESFGDKDAFIGKYSKTGEKTYLVQTGTKAFDSLQSISIGSDGFVIAVGYTKGDIKTGEQDAEEKITGLLVKLKENGEQHWIKTADLSHAWDVSAEFENYFFVAGSKEVDGQEVATVLKYDLGGTVKGRFSFPSEGDSISTDITFDKNNDLYIAGYFTGDLESNCVINLDDTNDGTDIFFGIFNPNNLELKFSGIYGTEKNDVNPKIAIDNSLNPHLLFYSLEDLTSSDAEATLVKLENQPVE